MSAFLNRLVLIVVGAVITAASVVLLLVETRVIDADRINDAVRYRSAIDDAVTWSNGDGISAVARTITVVGSLALVALGLWWLIRELSFGYRRAEEQIIEEADDTQVTGVNPAAVKHLVEGSALEAGALSAKATIRPGDAGHVVRCSVIGDEGTDLARLPVHVRQHIQHTLSKNELTHDSVTVTVDGVARRKRVVR